MMGFYRHFNINVDGLLILSVQSQYISAVGRKATLDFHILVGLLWFFLKSDTRLPDISGSVVVLRIKCHEITPIRELLRFFQKKICFTHSEK
jgi:hypothetical protein